MNVFDFLNKVEYDHIYRCVENKCDFDYEKEIKKVKLTIHNYYAVKCWDEKIKEGDYMISIGYSTPACGGGSPNTIAEFMKEFETYEIATKYIDKFIGRLEEYGYETLENTVEQMTLF